MYTLLGCKLSQIDYTKYYKYRATFDQVITKIKRANFLRRTILLTLFTTQVARMPLVFSVLMVSMNSVNTTS